MSRNEVTRRRFLTASAGLAAAGGIVPYFTSAAFGKPVKKRKLKGDWTIAAIGVGGRGAQDGHSAAQFGRMVACCDVDREHAEKFAAKYGGKCQIYGDYRKLLDRKDVQAVTIGTTDHWHTAIAIAALRAGKDVYCEKPLTLTIDEGKRICAAVKETGRVFQVGTQQRSEFGLLFLKAVAIARSGRLGKKLKAYCSIGGGPSGGPFPTAKPPASLDWDFWLGQAPAVDYTVQRCHGTFRWWMEYSGGKLTDWGAHHVDIAQWALGCENTGPIEIAGHGDFPNLPADFKPVEFFAGRQKLPNSYNTPTAFEINLSYANGNQIVVREGPGNGVTIEGENGRIFVSRSALKGKPIEDLSDNDKEWLDGQVSRLYRGKDLGGHMNNFFECVRDRSLPISDVFTHHRSISTCHMCNIAMLLRRKLQWDPEKQLFIGDDEANALQSRPQRKPYIIAD